MFDYSGAAAEAALLSSIRSDLHSGLFTDAAGMIIIVGDNTAKVCLGYIDTGSSVILEPMLVGDINHDGIVNAGDLTLMSGIGSSPAGFGQTATSTTTVR